MRSKVSETEVVRMWQRISAGGSQFASTDGRPLRIVYPGRANDEPGADFRDAVIESGQEVVQGDIEIHVKSSDWLAHRHHHNPTYNRVVLHVVLRQDTGTATFLQNGQSVPTLALEEYAPLYRGLALPVSTTPCTSAGECLNENKIAGLLDTAGDERFASKVDGFREALEKEEAGQCLYRGLMEALGYSRNKLPFRELAGRVPLNVLESLARGQAPDEASLARLQALLLGTAGLLPSQRSGQNQAIAPEDVWVNRLERLWTASRQLSDMCAGDWHLFKVRPVNSPVRRMAAMSYLVLRCREEGLLRETLGRVAEAVAGQGHHLLEEGFTVATGGYWSNHYDFGRTCRENTTLVGRGRAADIVINAVLPFSLALSQRSSTPGLAEGILELYRRYPRLEPNAVERHMRSQLRISHLVNSARRQQGLLHIYRSRCTQGLCCMCPLAG